MQFLPLRTRFNIERILRYFFSVLLVSEDDLSIFFPAFLV